MTESVVGLMFRSPEYGNVKKRLASRIGDDEALKAYTEMLYATLNNLRGLNEIDLLGFYHGSYPDYEGRKDIRLVKQEGKDLGERMFNAISYLYNKGFKRIVLIGSDSPDLPISYIRLAFLKLNDHDLVIGPAEDGGYYLIGMKRPIQLFKNIRWGSSSVLKDSIKKAEDMKVKYSLLPVWYDIDDIEGLRQWKNQQFPTTLQSHSSLCIPEDY